MILSVNAIAELEGVKHETITKYMCRPEFNKFRKGKTSWCYYDYCEDYKKLLQPLLMRGYKYRRRKLAEQQGKEIL